MYVCMQSAAKSGSQEVCADLVMGKIRQKLTYWNPGSKAQSLSSGGRRKKRMAKEKVACFGGVKNFIRLKVQ